jgi:hypothetical protein
MITNGILVKKVLDRNLNTGNASVTDRDIIDYYLGKYRELWICNEKGEILERYFGMGLQRLIESAKKTDLKNKYSLVKRIFANKK